MTGHQRRLMRRPRRDGFGVTCLISPGKYATTRCADTTSLGPLDVSGLSASVTQVPPVEWAEQRLTRLFVQSSPEAYLVGLHLGEGLRSAKWNAHMKDIQGAKLTFDKKGLAGFTDGELKCLYVFPHILNRLKMLDAQVFSHWAVGTDTSLPEPVRQAALCGVAESIFLTAGELKEAWEAIQLCLYKSQASKGIYAQLPDDIQAKLKRLRSPSFPGKLRS